MKVLIAGTHQAKGPEGIIEEIVAYLETRMENNAINPHPFERKHVAVASLLVEASRLDDHYDAGQDRNSDQAMGSRNVGWPVAPP